MRILILAAFIACLFAACAHAADRPPCTAVTAASNGAPASLSQQEIARRVEQAMRGTPYAEVVGHVQQHLLEGDAESVIHGLDPVTFRSHMAADRLRTDVYQNGRLILSLAAQNGRAQEYRPTMKNRPLIEFDAPYPHGTNDTIFSARTDCLTGTLGYSWFGVEPTADSRGDQAAFFRRRIEEGRQEQDITVGGRPCYVFRHVVEIRFDDGTPDDEIQQILYVDQEHYYVARWDTIVDGIQRVRTYEVRTGEMPDDDMVWRIDAPSAGRAPTAALRETFEHFLRRHEQAP